MMGDKEMTRVDIDATEDCPLIIHAGDRNTKFGLITLYKGGFIEINGDASLDILTLVKDSGSGPDVVSRPLDSPVKKFTQAGVEYDILVTPPRDEKIAPPPRRDGEDGGAGGFGFVGGIGGDGGDGFDGLHGAGGEAGPSVTVKIKELKGDVTVICMGGVGQDGGDGGFGGKGGKGGDGVETAGEGGCGGAAGRGAPGGRGGQAGSVHIQIGKYNENTVTVQAVPGKDGQAGKDGRPGADGPAGCIRLMED